MQVFSAKMRHSSETIRKLIQTEYDTYQFYKKFIQMALAIGLILYGLYANSSMVTPLFALFIGCLLVANINLYPRTIAKRFLSQIGEKYPTSDYSFNKNGFSYYSGGSEIPYKNIICLIEDQSYAYLFVDKQSAYMVDKNTVSGGSIQEFKQFISQKTNLKWKRRRSFFNFRLKDLFPNRKK